MWPSFASPLSRGLNRRLLVRSLTPLFADHPVVVTTLPLVADLPPHLPPARWVYYCVDDFSVWPGYDGATMRRMERDLVPHLSAAVAVSDTLVNHLATLGVPANLLTHGVDLDHWATPAGDCPELADLPRPVVLFWGVIDRRLDLAFVERLTAAMPTGTVAFVGPQEDPDPRLFALPRVAVRPKVGYDRLPSLAAAAAVLVMPYADVPATRAMQPLKLKEYLATGKPAVVRELPSTREWADACDVADTPDAFAAAVLERLATVLPAGQTAARGRLAAEGWAAKARQFEEWADGRGFSPPAGNA
jgi:glycosyltransferase involved in cell wall biosynthesis